MKPCRRGVCMYAGCVSVEPSQERHTLLLSKNRVKILATEGHGVTSEANAKSR